MTFNYQEKLEINKNSSVTYLIKKLREEGINRAPNSKQKMKYTSIKNLTSSDLAKVLTDVQEKKEKGMKNKIDRLTLENWGSRDTFVKYITKNNLFKGTKTSLVNSNLDKLKDIILKKHGGLSPRKSPVSSPRKSHVSSPRKSPMSSPRKSPMSSPRKSPMSSPRKSPMSSPRKSPVSSPRKSPVSSPIKSPAKYEINPSTNKKRKSCKKNQIRNPKTGRCNINKNYRSPVASSRKSPMTSSRKKSPVKYEINPSTNKKRKSCKKNQIRNPKTGRCNINKNYRSPVTLSPLKKNGMVSCNKCGSLILKIKLKKHQESNKCIRSPTFSIDTPIKRKIKRKIITDDDTDDENVTKSISSVSTTLTPIKRKRKRKIITDDDTDESVSSPKSISSSIKRQSVIEDEKEEDDMYLQNEEDRADEKEKEEDRDDEKEEDDMYLQNIEDKDDEDEKEDEEDDMYLQNAEEEEKDDEENDMYLQNTEEKEDEDDDLYISEKSVLEEGDEIDEVEEIDDVKDIDSKLNEINNIVVKDENLIKNKILRHLGLL